MVTGLLTSINSIQSILDRVVDPVFDYLLIKSNLQKPGPQVSTSQTLENFALIRSSSTQVSRGLFDLFDRVKSMRASLRPIGQYYDLDKLRSALVQESTVLKYAALAGDSVSQNQGNRVLVESTIAGDSSTSQQEAAAQEKRAEVVPNNSLTDPISSPFPSGMEIEFRNVSST